MKHRHWGIFVGSVGLTVALACGTEPNQPAASPVEGERHGGGGSGEGGQSNGKPPSSGGREPTQSPEETLLEQPFVLTDVRLITGEQVNLVVEDGMVATAEPGSVGTSVPASDYYAFPAFIDSHVHFSYFPVVDEVARKGVLAAVDLAAPIESLATPPETLELISAGPMITSLMGYPTQSWGSNGYGLETANVASAREAVGQLVAAGARVIKVPVDGEMSITDAQLAAIVEASHDAGLKVAAHALSADGARRAAEQGCDVLAHTPTEELSDDIISAWSDRAVISTLKAFGAAEVTLSNLTKLYASGATVLYGTDLGNTRAVGLDIGEVELLERVGLTRAQALAAATTTAAEYWGIEVGTDPTEGEASFVLLSGDPTEDLTVLLEPDYVFYRGQTLTQPAADDAP